VAQSIQSINALAKLVDKSAPAVRKWLEHGEWPFARVAPWAATLVPRMKEWAAATLQEDRASTAPKVLANQTRLKELKLVEEIKVLRRTNKVGDQEVHGIAECEQAQTERIQFVKNSLCSEKPSTIAQAILARWPAVRSIAGQLELADVIRTGIEDAIAQLQPVKT
jgi:hypothetical protein